MENLITEELNVKAIKFVSDEGELLTKKADPVFKQLGPKFGKLVNRAADAIRSFGEDEIESILNNGGERLVVDGHEAMIEPDDITIKTENKPGLAASSEGDLTIALVTNITEELLHEGLAREFVNRVQNMRKDSGFDVTDRINISVDATADMDKAIKTQTDYIKNETLCVELNFGQSNGDSQKDFQIDEHSISIGISKIE
jgi:isoleucyl-tRNA synthetase